MARLLHLADALGISHERILAIGDNLDDLSMVLEAAVGVAMGNVVPELRRR